MTRGADVREGMRVGARERTGIPAAKKNLAIEGLSGAPPDTKKRSLPPTRERSLLNTSRSATRCLIASHAGIGFPARPRSAQASPVRLAHLKIANLTGDLAAVSTTRL